MLVKVSLAAALSSMVICPVHAESGLAAFYGGGLTASGEVTEPTGLTAAHRTLPFGAKGAGDQCSQWQNGGRAHHGSRAVWPWSNYRREPCGGA